MYKRIQGNGSITIPVMLRRSLGIQPRDAMEIITQDDGSIVLRPCTVECVFCGGTENVGVRKGVRMCLACYQKINVRKEDRNGRNETGNQIK